MSKFYFRKKTCVYYLSIISIIGAIFLSIIGTLYFCFGAEENSVFNIGSVFFFSTSLIFLVFLFSLIKSYNKFYKISDKKLKFYGNAGFDSIVRYDKIFTSLFKKQQLQVVSITDIKYCFITEFHYRIGNSTLYIEKEKVNNEKHFAGYIFLLNKFVYDKERCNNSYSFNQLNKRKDYLSQFYETLCSMIYQEDALNELYKNGFCGDIFLSSTIYQPRKQVFDELFVKYSVPVEKIHIFKSN